MLARLLPLIALAAGLGAQTSDWILEWEALERQAHSPAGAARVAGLIDGDEAPWVRARALVALAAASPRAAAGRLESLAGADDPVLRQAAAEAAGHLRDDRSRSLLATLLKDAERSVALAAAVAVARREGGDAWREVRDLVAELDPAHALQQGRILASVGSEAAAGRWDTLRETAEGAAGRDLIAALAWSDGARWRLRLQDLLLEDRTAADARGAILALDRDGFEAFLEDSLDATAQSLHRAAVGLVFLRPTESGRQRVERLLRSGELEASAVAFGLDLLRAEVGSAAPEIVRRYLGHEDKHIRRRAVRLVAAVEDDAVRYELLAPAIADGDKDVVQEAVAVIVGTTEAAPEGGIVPYAVDLLAKDQSFQELGIRLIARHLTEAEAEAALAALRPFLRSESKDLRRDSRAALQQVGGWRVAQLLGYVPRWQIIGPFDNDDDNAGFARVLPPERRVDLTAEYPVGERHAATGVGSLRWREARVISSGELLLHDALPPPVELNVAYAYAECSLDRQQRATLQIAGDDAVAVWLNGERIYSGGGDRTLSQETKDKSTSDRRKWWDKQRKDVEGWYPAVDGEVEVQLQAGRNRLLVKCANLDIYWWCRVRLLDEDGKPLEVDW